MAGKHIPEDIIVEILSKPLYAEWIGDHAKVLGSCNGLVCVATRPTPNTRNPSSAIHTKVFPMTLARCTEYISYSGFGYLPDTEDYKVVVAVANYSWQKPVPVEVMIFSTRAGLWKRIESPFNYTYNHSGALLGKTLHWVCIHKTNLSLRPVLYAFDLEEEKFREIPLPTSHQDVDTISLHGVDSCGGCLYGFFYRYGGGSGCLELWVMREYEVRDSWTKLFNFKVLNQLMDPKYWVHMFLSPFLATETSTVVKLSNTMKDYGRTEIIIRIRHEDEPVITDRLKRWNIYNMCRNDGMFVYEESLLWIPDYPVLMPAELRIPDHHAVVPAKLKSRGTIARCLDMFKCFCYV